MQEIKTGISDVDILSAQESSHSKKTNLFEKISFLSLLISSFLSPFFFIPFKFTNLNSVKSLMIVSAVLISLIFWCLARLKDGKFDLIQS